MVAHHLTLSSFAASLQELSRRNGVWQRCNPHRLILL
jgi:hypothetical protein